MTYSNNPPNFFLDTKVHIHKGELVSGVVDKRALGRSFGSLIHVLWNDYGPEICRSFIDELQLIITQWLLHEGASVGIGDTIADSNTLYEIDTTIVNAKKEVTGIINRARSGELSRFPGQTIMETFETNVIFYIFWLNIFLIFIFYCFFFNFFSKFLTKLFLMTNFIFIFNFLLLFFT